MGRKLRRRRLLCCHCLSNFSILILYTLIVAFFVIFIFIVIYTNFQFDENKFYSYKP